MLPSLLTKTATVLRYTPNGSDRLGHTKGTYEPAGSFACSLQTLSGREVYALVGGDRTDNQTQVVIQHRVFANAGADVTEADRLLIDGVTYHVALVSDPTGHGHHLEIDLYRVKGSRV